MKRKVWYALPLASVLFGSAILTTFSGCGNGWLDSGERDKTPAALMFEAQQAYDKATSPADYAKSTALYRAAVEKDPMNVNARIGLAFALNGEAGLSIIDLIGRALREFDSGSSSSGTNLAASSSDGLGKVLRIAGMDSSEMNTLLANTGNNISTTRTKTAAELRAASTKLQKLHESWLAICPVLSTDIINELKTDPDTAANFELDKCKGGLPESSVNVGTIFASTLSNLALAMSLFQIIDQNGAPNGTSDGIPDVITEVSNTFTTSMANITTAQNAITAAAAAPTDPQKPFENINTINTQLATVSGEVKKINDAIGTVNAEVNNMTLSSLQLLTSLANMLARKAGLPKQVTDAISSATTNLTSAKAKLDEYSSAVANVGTSAPTTSETTAPSKSTETTAKIVEASQKADTMLGQQMAKLNDPAATGAGREEQIKKLEDNKLSICANFSELAIGAGLGANAQKPCACGDTADERNTCCAKKATDTEQNECCTGAYPAAEAAKVPKCQDLPLATGLWAGFLIQEKTTNTTYAPKTEDTKEISAGFLSLFDGAFDAWRSGN